MEDCELAGRINDNDKQVWYLVYWLKYEIEFVTCQKPTDTKIQFS